MKILIVKVSSLGDVVHALPIVADIRRAHPNAVIDWVVEPAFAGIVGLVKGVRRVIPFALRRWRKQPFAAVTRAEVAGFWKLLRSERYDLVLDVQGLVKTALVAAAAHGPVAGIGNRTDGSSYEKPARWFYDRAIAVAPHTHVVTRGRVVAAAALGYALAEPLDFGLDLARAPNPCAELVAAGQRYAVFVHATSRADKCWPDAHWIALGRDFVAATGASIVLPWGSAAERAVSERIAQQLGDAAIVPPALSLPEVVGLIGGAVATVGVDTGLIHIASALAGPTIQLYNFDTSWRTGGFWSPQLVNLGGAQSPQPAEVWAALQRLQVV